MDKENFLRFVSQVEWRFAKSVPNWPHFYIVEENLPDQAAFRAAREFVRESGRVGKFFDMDVFYFDADGWDLLGFPLSEAARVPIHAEQVQDRIQLRGMCSFGRIANGRF